MILYIDNKLSQWGLWCLSGRDRVGYPRQSAFARLMPSGGGGLAICDDEAMQINRAVQRLDAGLRRLVELMYIRMRNCDAGSVARELHCCRDTFYTRLHQAHLAVQCAIEDEELTRSDSSCKKLASSGLLHPKQTSKACES